MSLKLHCRRALPAALLSLASLPAAAAPAGEIDALLHLTIEELLATEVTSAARKPQSINDTAAAVFVITADDIRASGAQHVAELLRMVPGMQVAAYNSHHWAVSARGFNDLFANKMLVLLDGRSLYSWTFTGVPWYRVAPMLEDIERIEVIRGPGGTLWGANAVNGVVNIITKRARDSQGALLVAGGGNVEQGVLRARYGGETAGGGAYRVHADLQRRGDFDGALADDHWHSGGFGFRVDSAPDDEWSWSISGDYRGGELEELHWNPLVPREVRFEGYSLLGRIESGERWRLQAYFEHFETDYPTPDAIDQLDLEWQQLLRPAAGHELVWGGNLRWMSSETPGGHGFSMVDHEVERGLVGLFAQDEIELIDERFWLTVGAKLEKHEGLDAELLPNLRGLWRLGESHRLWAAVSRSVRTPARLGRELTMELPGPGYRLRLLPNADLEPEVLVAYELGLRGELTHRLSWDGTLFRHDYDQLIYRDISFTVDPLGPVVLLPAVNGGESRIHGAELAFSYIPHRDWSLRGAFSYAGDPRGSVPTLPHANRQASLRARWRAAADVDVSGTLRYVDAVCDFAGPVIAATGCVDDYTELDLRLAWRPRKGTELSLVGRNLLHDRHLESESSGGDYLVAETPRSLFLQARFDF